MSLFKTIKEKKMNKNLFNKLNVVYLSIQNKLPILLGKIFTKPNLNKVIIIFIVGFISRVFIVNIYNINVYFEYLSIISILYYSCMSFFIVVVHELVNYFEFNIIPSYLLELYTVVINIIKNIINFGKYLREIINYTNKLIFSLKLSEFKISSIRKNFMLYLNKEKMTLDVDISDNPENIEITDKMVNSNVLQKNRIKSSRGRSIHNNNGASSSNTGGTRAPRRREDGFYFLVDTIRDSVASIRGEPARSLPTPESRSTVSTPSSTSPIMPPAPNLYASNLSTPTVSTIKSKDMFVPKDKIRYEAPTDPVYSPKFNDASIDISKLETLTNAVYTPEYKNTTVKPIGATNTAYSEGSYSTPVTNAQENSYTYNPTNEPISSQNTYYPAANSFQEVNFPANNATSGYNQYYYTNNDVNPVRRKATHFDFKRESSSTKNPIIGLNASNENTHTVRYRSNNTLD